MNCKELIEILKTMPEDAEVTIGYEGYYEPEEIIIAPRVEKLERVIDGELISIGGAWYLSEGGEKIEIDAIVLGTVKANP